MSVTHTDQRRLSDLEEVRAFQHFRDVLGLSRDQLQKMWRYSGISRIEEKERMLVGAAGPVIDGDCRELPQAERVERSRPLKEDLGDEISFC